MPDRVTVCECFARDGLQHEPVFVPTSAKVELLDAMSGAGFARIEATSYSNPAVVPAFRDASEVLARIARPAGVAFKATCPNPRAVLRALDDADAGHGADELSLLVSATESHSARNLRADRDTQWQRIAEMVRLAANRFRLVGVVSVAFGCPFEGHVDPGVVSDDVGRFVDLGAELVTLGDTTGLATPRTAAALFRRLSAEYPATALVAHLHNTRGTALANAVAALDAGCRHFDSAFGGVGGHPAQVVYGGGFTGNAATEDLVGMLEAMGVDTGLDLDRLSAISARCERVLGRELHSLVARSGWSVRQGDRVHV